MKKKLLLLLAWFPIMLIGQNAVDKTIMVIADPHVMAESLLDSGVAFDDMIAKQRKMLDMSEMAFKALVDTALFYHPSLVLIPGDLTKDGELVSHNVVLSQLERLQEVGIKTLLIPGNHDIGGTAYSYIGEEKTSVETLADTDWESTYAMVYDQAIAKDPHSTESDRMAQTDPRTYYSGIHTSHIHPPQSNLVRSSWLCNLTPVYRVILDFRCNELCTR